MLGMSRKVWRVCRSTATEGPGFMMDGLSERPDWHLLHYLYHACCLLVRLSEPRQVGYRSLGYEVISPVNASIYLSLYLSFLLSITQASQSYSQHYRLLSPTQIQRTRYGGYRNFRAQTQAALWLEERIPIWPISKTSPSLPPRLSRSPNRIPHTLYKVCRSREDFLGVSASMCTADHATNPSLNTYANMDSISSIQRFRLPQF
jgi:hypothetical protein